MRRKAAAIIYTRTKYIGFPSGFAIQPGDFTEKEVEELSEYVHEAMDSVVELRSLHKCTKVIIRKEQYVVLGMIIFLRDLVKDGWEALDKGKRLTYGFFGFVWHVEDFEYHGSFPGKDNFAKLMEIWIRPHWEDSENCRWAEMPHFSEYEYDVEFEEDILSVGESQYVPKMYEGKTVLVSSGKEKDMLYWGMKKLMQDSEFSLCTNVCVYSERDFSSRFQYVVKLNDTNSKSFDYNGRRDEQKKDIISAEVHQKNMQSTVEEKEDAWNQDMNQASTKPKEKEKYNTVKLVGVAVILLGIILIISGKKLLKISGAAVVLLGIGFITLLLFHKRGQSQENVSNDIVKEIDLKANEKNAVNNMEMGSVGDSALLGRLKQASIENGKQTGLGNENRIEKPISTEKKTDMGMESKIQKKKRETTEDIFTL